MNNTTLIAGARTADPLRFNVGPASATSDQYCISIGSTHSGCWVDLKHCEITILMVTEYHPSLSSSAVGWRVVGPYVQIILTSEVRSAIEVKHEMISLLANQHAVCPRREILETNRAYHIWRWMSAIVSHFKWCHRWLITDQDTNHSP